MPGILTKSEKNGPWDCYRHEEIVALAKADTMRHSLLIPIFFGLFFFSYKLYILPVR